MDESEKAHQIASKTYDCFSASAGVGSNKAILPSNHDWNPYPEIKPEDGFYNVTIVYTKKKGKEVRTVTSYARFLNGTWLSMNDEMVSAWMVMPEPYNPV